MKTIFTLLLCVLASNTHAIEHTDDFVSPDKSCILRYEGAASRGDGIFYDVTNGNAIIHRGYLRYGPIVNWESGSLAELRVPTGSPNYHSYFYNCRNQTTSPAYSLPIAVDTASMTVATLSQQAISFHALNEEKPFYTHEAPEVGLAEYFIYCDHSAIFKTSELFIIELTCNRLKDVHYEISVPAR